MLVEIVSTQLDNGVVKISAIDCSEENLQRLERIRDDGVEKEVEFLFDTHNRKCYWDFYKWLKSQKATSRAGTWGEALFAVIGTVTTISNKYRVWE